MFRITEDPSSGSLIQCLAKITNMVLPCPLTWTWSVLWQRSRLNLSLKTENEGLRSKAVLNSSKRFNSFQYLIH